MEYRPLGRTGVQVSAVCIGCWMFGNRVAPDDAARIVHASLDEGVNFFDTSNIYPRGGVDAGRSEQILGRAIQDARRRDHVVLATKVGRLVDDAHPNGRGLSRRHIVEQCERSLRNLATDHIDLYYLHRPPVDLPVDECLRALDDLICSGKVRSIGTSHSSAWAFVESLWVSKELGLNRFVAEQPPYNLLDRRIERELIPMARTFGVAVNPYMPLGGSLLTGVYRRGEPVPEDSRYADEAYASLPRYKDRFTDAVYDVNDVLAELAREKGCSQSALAFDWVLRQPGITSPILGAEHVEELVDVTRSLDVELTPSDCAALDAVVPPFGHVSPFYEPDTTPHLFGMI